MAKFEESRPDHEVHEVAHRMGHGYLDQKHHKGMRSPAVAETPTTASGAAGEMQAPGQGMYEATDSTGS